MEPLPQKLKGRVALVTGAGRGLGRAIALRLARLGADVVINDIRLDSAVEFKEDLNAPTVVEECEAHGVRSIGIEADVTKRDEVAGMMNRIEAEFGSLDILVAVAGGQLRPTDGGRTKADRMSDDDTRFILDVNFMSTVITCQEAVRIMRKKAYGKIVTMASCAAFSKSNLAAYGAAKAAIVSFTRSLAAEAGPSGITVNSIAPAIIGTSRALSQFPERKDMGSRTALGRIGEPEDVARVVEFFVTDLSDYVTGQCLPVCGGMYFGPA